MRTVKRATTRAPAVVALAGPNGAGKSTAAPFILRDNMEVEEFVNADLIAQGLSPFKPEGVALEAAKLMLRRMHELAAKRHSFAFETNLASRHLAPWIAELTESGYRFHLIFLWLPSADVAVERVAERVQLGGHAVPEATIRRRYESGPRNFFELFQPLTHSWIFYHPMDGPPFRIIAEGQGVKTTKIADTSAWKKIQKEFAHAKA